MTMDGMGVGATLLLCPDGISSAQFTSRFWSANQSAELTGCVVCVCESWDMTYSRDYCKNLNDDDYQFQLR